MHIFGHNYLLSNITKFIILPSAILSFITIVSLEPTLWVSSEIHHFYIELIAVILGADLEYLCKEAAMKCLRRLLPELNLEDEKINPEACFAASSGLLYF